MRLLLDTHTILWAVADDPRLSASAKSAIYTAEEVYWSPLSLWEMAIKISLKKRNFQLAADWHVLIPHYLQENRCTKLEISSQHCAVLSNLPHHHRDPFDRLLITTAQCEDLTIVSRDTAFHAYNVKTLW